MVFYHIIQNQHFTIAYSLQRAAALNHAIHPYTPHTVAIVRGEGNREIRAAFQHILTRRTNRSVGIICRHSYGIHIHCESGGQAAVATDIAEGIDIAGRIEIRPFFPIDQNRLDDMAWCRGYRHRQVIAAVHCSVAIGQEASSIAHNVETDLFDQSAKHSFYRLVFLHILKSIGVVSAYRNSIHQNIRKIVTFIRLNGEGLVVAAKELYRSRWCNRSALACRCRNRFHVTGKRSGNFVRSRHMSERIFTDISIINIIYKHRINMIAIIWQNVKMLLFAP